MKNTAILSLITATLLISSANAEEVKLSSADYLKKAVLEMEKIVGKKVETDVKAEVKTEAKSDVKQELTSIGRDKNYW